MSASSVPASFTTYLAFFLDERHPRFPGLRAVEPEPGSHQASRGRFYALVEIMGDSPVKEQAVSQIQSVLEHTYYTAGGSLSAVLEQAISNAHEVLYALNQRNPNTELRAGILCAALVQQHLIMASVGPGLALLSTDSRVDQFPSDPAHFTDPIGGERPPHVAIFRHHVQEGDVLFLGESDWILLSDIKTLGGAVASTTRENRYDVVEYMRQQSGSAQVLGLLAVIDRKRTTFLEPEPAEQPPKGLPTALGAKPPVRTVPTDLPEPPPVAETTPQVWETAPGDRPRPASQPTSPSAPSQRVEVVPRGAPERIPRRSERVQASDWWRRFRNWFHQLRTNILPDKGRGSRAAASDWVGPHVVDAPSESVPTPRPPRDLTPPERTRGSRARLFILLGLLVPLLAAAVVGGVYLRKGAVTRGDAQKLVDMAEVEVVRARQALDVGDELTARDALNNAQKLLENAIDLIGMTDRIAELLNQIKIENQALTRSRNLYGLDVPLTDFPENADPHRVLVFDQDVYVLDTGLQMVSHFRTDPGRSIRETGSEAILRQGDIVDGITVGRLVDIAWQPRITGFVDKASLLVLDRNNNVFRYNPVDGVTHLRLANGDALQSVVQMEVYNGRLYLADEQRNQIFRYAPAGLGYDQPPDEWFAPQVQVNLAGLVSMAIDSDIWLLLENGSLLRFRERSQLPFSLDAAPGLGGRMVDMAISSRSDGHIYLADAAQERILVFDKQGAYIEQFQASDSAALRGLRGIYLDEANGMMFILTQTSLFAHPLPE